MSKVAVDYRFGHKHKSLGLDAGEVRPKSECKKPNHPVRIEIRKGLTVYAAKGCSVARIKQKYKGK